MRGVVLSRADRFQVACGAPRPRGCPPGQGVSASGHRVTWQVIPRAAVRCLDRDPWNRGYSHVVTLRRWLWQSSWGRLFCGLLLLVIVVILGLHFAAVHHDGDHVGLASAAGLGLILLLCLGLARVAATKDSSGRIDPCIVRHWQLRSSYACRSIPKPAAEPLIC